MIAGYKKKSMVALVAWLLLRLGLLIGLFYGYSEEHAGLRMLALFLVFLLGTVAIFYCCYAQAKCKGYSGAFALLGLIGVAGLIVLALLPDKTAPPPMSPVPLPNSFSARMTPLENAVGGLEVLWGTELRDGFPDFPLP